MILHQSKEHKFRMLRSKPVLMVEIMDKEKYRKVKETETINEKGQRNASQIIQSGFSQGNYFTARAGNV